MSRQILASVAALCAILALGPVRPARVGGYGGQPVRSAAAAPTMTMEQPIEAVPSAPVTSEPLAPIEGQPLPPIGGTLPPASCADRHGEPSSRPPRR